MARNKIFNRLKLAALVVIISNVFWFFGGTLIFEGVGKSYEYSTIDRVFVDKEIPAKGKPLSSVEKRYAKWKESNAIPSKESTLYRNFKRNWLCFWKWYDYLIHPRWDYPYIQAEQ